MNVVDFPRRVSRVLIWGVLVAAFLMVVIR